MSSEICVMCNHSDNDVLEMGEKYSHKNISAHYFCLLLSSNLLQQGNDDEGILGFMNIDIQNEVDRAHKLKCCFCQKTGASIGCCKKACRKSFHLPCAIKRNCLFEFTDTFRSFCHLHHNNAKPLPDIHKPDDLCAVCYDKMGEYNPIRSIQSPCCNKSAWYHKRCLLQLAQTSGYFFKCPLCNNTKEFREKVRLQGIFIPDKDADWETEESEPNTFYRFSQHYERPNECVAEPCKCPQGSKYYTKTENSKFSLIFCEYCGSHGIHRSCLTNEVFLCNECSVMSNKLETNNDTDDEQDSSLAIIEGGCDISPSSSIIDDGCNESNEIERCDGNSRGSSNHSNMSTSSTIDVDSIKHTHKNSSFSDFFCCDLTACGNQNNSLILIDPPTDLVIDLTEHDSTNSLLSPQTPDKSIFNENEKQISESSGQKTEFDLHNHDDDENEILSQKIAAATDLLFVDTDQSDTDADIEEIIPQIISNINNFNDCACASNQPDCTDNIDNANIDSDHEQFKPIALNSCRSVIVNENISQNKNKLQHSNCSIGVSNRKRKKSFENRRRVIFASSDEDSPSENFHEPKRFQANCSSVSDYVRPLLDDNNRKQLNRLSLPSKLQAHKEDDKIEYSSKE